MTERTQSPYFVRQWGAGCVVASVRDGQRLSIRKSSVAYCVLRPLVFIGVVKLLFFLVAGPLRHCLALLFYPIARHQCRGVLPVLCQSVQLACSSRYL